MIFAENMEEITAHNAKGTETYFLRENQFTDLTNEEWRAAYLGFRNPKAQNSPKEIKTVLPDSNQNYNISWIGTGALGQVLNQG
jgi:C1A family cysteine protease